MANGEYTIPLAAFAPLFAACDRRLYHELAQRLRAEVHSDLERRDRRRPVSSAVRGQDIVVWRGDSELSALARRAPSLRGVLSDDWRYPGTAENGIFSKSVDAVIARAHVLEREFADKGARL